MPNQFGDWQESTQTDWQPGQAGRASFGGKTYDLIPSKRIVGGKTRGMFNETPERKLNTESLQNRRAYEEAELSKWNNPYIREKNLMNEANTKLQSLKPQLFQHVFGSRFGDERSLDQKAMSAWNGAQKQVLNNIINQLKGEVETGKQRVKMSMESFDFETERRDAKNKEIQDLSKTFTPESIQSYMAARNEGRETTGILMKGKGDSELFKSYGPEGKKFTWEEKKLGATGAEKPGDESGTALQKNYNFLTKAPFNKTAEEALSFLRTSQGKSKEQFLLGQFEKARANYGPEDTKIIMDEAEMLYDKLYGKKKESKEIDEATAKEILKEAGGNKEKARKLAKERGYTF